MVAHSIFGVAGDLETIVKTGNLFKTQKWTSNWHRISWYGESAQMRVFVRYDDECGNKHHSFAITAEILVRGQDSAGGCLHDEIAQFFPKLTPLIQWHHMDSDGPMHYPGNTLYHASDLDHSGKAKGEPNSWEERIKFENFPISITVKNEFLKWLKEAEKFNASALKTNPDYIHFDIVEVPHGNKPGGHQYSPNYTFKGYREDSWGYAPFTNLNDIQEFKEALKLPHEYVKVVTGYSDGKKRELDYARKSAVWPEATDEQLCLPREELKALLEARLPMLVANFKQLISDIGFQWEPTSEILKEGE